MGMGWWMIVPLLLLLLVLVVSAVWARVAMTGGRPGSRTPREEPELILAERFARCAIDEQEYRRRLDVLRGGQRDRQGSMASTWPACPGWWEFGRPCLVHKDVQAPCGPHHAAAGHSDAANASIKHIACGLGGIPACSWCMVQLKHDCGLSGSASGARSAAIVLWVAGRAALWEWGPAGPC
jgi:putative membrane protein